jgi:hypothetical protein
MMEVDESKRLESFTRPCHGPPIRLSRSMGDVVPPEGETNLAQVR